MLPSFTRYHDATLLRARYLKWKLWSGSSSMATFASNTFLLWTFPAKYNLLQSRNGVNSDLRNLLYLSSIRNVFQVSIDVTKHWWNHQGEYRSLRISSHSMSVFLQTLAMFFDSWVNISCWDNKKNLRIRFVGLDSTWSPKLFLLFLEIRDTWIPRFRFQERVSRVKCYSNHYTRILIFKNIRSQFLEVKMLRSRRFSQTKTHF